MRTVVLVMLLLAGSQVFAQQPDKKDLPRPLPDAVVKAWEDAGAEVGWMKINRFGRVEFSGRPSFDAIPAFTFRKWTAGLVAKLPTPDSAFGLDLSNTQVTDAGLKELAPLKNLTSLGLWNTQVTNAGLKELAPLKKLTYLNLSDTKVTKDGVAELRKALPKCEIFAP